MPRDLCYQPMRAHIPGTSRASKKNGKQKQEARHGEIMRPCDNEEMKTLPEDSLAFTFCHAAHIISLVRAGQSLADGLLERVPEVTRPAVRDHVYRCLRQYGRGDFFLERLLHKPLAEPEIRDLLLVALYRLEFEPETAHTVVNQAVMAAGVLGERRAGGLVNAVLRNFLRQKNELQAAAQGDLVANYHYPKWWLQHLRRAYPSQWQEIAMAGNLRPPMALRVNRRRITREDWLSGFLVQQQGAVARGKDGVLLEHPLPVQQLPGFAAGLVSVQDLGAQRAADLLAPEAGSRVLDACAAPGGKAAHLLEAGERLELLALDLKPPRCRQVSENLERLGLTAEIKCADCKKTDEWWDGRLFDAILADVPCTASGVVRRHPDVKWLRRESDIVSFAEAQSAILNELWRVLRPGGKLLYATCSVFPAENNLQMAAFLARTPDSAKCHEEQVLPDHEHDGFYYCLVEKKL